jgi:hypothetical protein
VIEYATLISLKNTKKGEKDMIYAGATLILIAAFAAAARKKN